MNGAKTNDEANLLTSMIEYLEVRLSEVKQGRDTLNLISPRDVDLTTFELTDMFSEGQPIQVYNVVNMRLFPGDYNRDRINVVYYTTDKQNPHLRDFLYCNPNNPSAYDRAVQWYLGASDGDVMPKDSAEIVNDEDLLHPKRVVCQVHPTKKKRNGGPIMSVVGHEF